MKRKILVFFLLILLFLPIIKISWEKKDYYLAPFDSQRAEKLYNISQYVREKDASWIADEILFSYAGLYYLNGGNPILVNPENPPLGKYIIGVFIKIFNNEKIPSLIFAFLGLFSLFLLSSQFFKNKWLAILPVILFAWEKLFAEQIIFVPLLETISLTFLNFSILFFIKAQEKSKYFFAANLFLGLLWASRPWMATVPLIASWTVYLLFFSKDRRKFIYWLLTTPVAVCALFLSYFKLFAEGWNMIKVLSVQKWILWYHQSRLIKLGSVWPYIYANRWYVWWGDQPFIAINQWTVAWPVSTTLSLIFSFLVFLRNLWPKSKIISSIEFDRKIAILCLWLVFYLVFLSIGNITSRYIFYLLPYCYVLSIYFFASIFKRSVRVRL